jgi:hypothetical protein
VSLHGHACVDLHRLIRISLLPVGGRTTPPNHVRLASSTGDDIRRHRSADQGGYGGGWIGPAGRRYNDSHSTISLFVLTRRLMLRPGAVTDEGEPPAEAAVSSGAYCMKPHIDRRTVITKPAHDTDMGTENGPTCTVHRFCSLIRCPIATTAKISAENSVSAHQLAVHGIGHDPGDESASTRLSGPRVQLHI